MDPSVLLAQMRADEVRLSVQNEDGWIVTFDRTPLKVQLATGSLHFGPYTINNRSKEEN